MITDTTTKPDKIKNGFTLIEVLIAALITAMAIVALVTSSMAYTNSNSAAIDLTNAEFLIEQIREITASMPIADPQTDRDTFGPETDESSVALYDDVDDFANASFNPPVDINGAALNDFSAYTQQVTVQNVNPSDFTQTVANHTSDFVKVQVTILKNNTAVAVSSWITARIN